MQTAATNITHERQVNFRLFFKPSVVHVLCLLPLFAFYFSLKSAGYKNPDLDFPKETHPNFPAIIVAVVSSSRIRYSTKQVKDSGIFTIFVGVMVGWGEGGGSS